MKRSRRSFRACQTLSYRKLTTYQTLWHPTSTRGRLPSSCRDLTETTDVPPSSGSCWQHQSPTVGSNTFPAKCWSQSAPIFWSPNRRVGGTSWSDTCLKRGDMKPAERASLCKLKVAKVSVSGSQLPFRRGLQRQEGVPS